MTEAVGPVFTGGFEEFVITDENGEGHTLLFLPDRNNDALQQERKPPVFYYIPEKVRLARDARNNDFKFRHIHYVGVFDETTAGIDRGETSGGVLALTTTSRFAATVLKQAEGQILDRFSGRNDKYWGLRTRVAPQIRIAPINANQTAISSLAPDSSGATLGMDAGGVAAQPNVPEGPRSRDAAIYGNRSPWAPVPHGREFRGAQIDAWAWRLQGNGPGSITGGENAYGGLIGPIPSEIVWAGFHGTYSTLFVTQNLILPMWSQQMHVKITGKWDRIFQHFSGHANARYLWFSADIKAEFNNLRISGGIKVEVDIDGTMPGAGEMEKMINQRIDLIVQLFTEQAKKVIFDPPQPQVEPAQAPSGGIFSSIFGGGAGLALKFRVDQQHVDLSYEETRYFRYNQPHTISSSLEGFYNEIKNDPKAESKYFQRLILGDLNRKIMRIVKPVVNWPDKARNWAGEPVSFVSTQIGYPTQQGDIAWKPTTFQKTDTEGTTFRPVWIQWRKGEVTNAPNDWDPDETYVKRKIHLLEPPTESEFPFFQIDVEQNVLDLDPDPNGTLTNDNILEVRADSAGTLDVGPIALSVELQSSAEIVEVEFRAKGTRADGTDRKTKVRRFRWMVGDQNEPRFWRIYTGQPTFTTDYEYRVNVTVRGTLSQKGQAWSGSWEPSIGNGPIMANVPLPDDPGVTKRQLTLRELFSNSPVRAAEGIEGGAGISAPTEQPGVVPPPPVVGVPVSVPQPQQPPIPPSSGSVPAPVSGESLPPRSMEPSPTSPPSSQRTGAPREVAGYGVDRGESAEGWSESAVGGSAQKTIKKSRESTSTTETKSAEGWIDQPSTSNQ